MSELKAPEGWALVPVKPTQDMVNAAKEIDGRLSVWKWADGYAAMLKAAPTLTEPFEAQELAAFEVIDQAGKSALFLYRERATDYAAQHKAVARFELVRRKP